jgi:membrane-associated phospholipid phosphatase
MLLGYTAFTTVLGLLRLTEQPVIGWVLASNLLTVLLVLLASHPDLGRLGRILREAYPLVLLSALYPAIDIINNFGAVAVYDPIVRRWEHFLFGAELSRVWWQGWPSTFWSTVLHGAYFAYYPVMVAPFLVFFISGRLEAARRAVLWLLSTYLICYVVFLLFPVAGPYYEFPRPDAWFLDNPTARLVYATLDRGSAYGAAFPSSHVAATLVAVAAAFRGSRTLGWILLLPAILLTVGVVYCQMHYAVDALAGVLLSAIIVGFWLWWEKRQTPGFVAGERSLGSVPPDDPGRLTAVGSRPY